MQVDELCHFGGAGNKLRTPREQAEAHAAGGARNGRVGVDRKH